MNLRKTGNNVLVLLLAACFLTTGIPLGAAERPEDCKPTPEIVRLMKGYEEVRAKQQKISSTFDSVHYSAGAPGRYSAGAPSRYSAGAPSNRQRPAGLSSKDLDTAIVSSRLEAIAIYLKGQNDNGNGPLHYWVRTWQILAKQGCLAVDELNETLKKHGDCIDDSLWSSIKTVSKDLDQAMKKYDQVSGGLEHWVSASRDVQKALWQAVANVEEIRRKISPASISDPRPLVKGQLEVVRNFLAGQFDQGNGDMDYWARTHGLLALQASLAAKVLSATVDRHGDKISGSLRTSIDSEAWSLREAAVKYVAGRGDADYWMRVSRATLVSIQKASRNLGNIIESIQNKPSGYEKPSSGGWMDDR